MIIKTSLRRRSEPDVVISPILAENGDIDIPPVATGRKGTKYQTEQHETFNLICEYGFTKKTDSRSRGLFNPVAIYISRLRPWVNLRNVNRKRSNRHRAPVVSLGLAVAWKVAMNRERHTHYSHLKVRWSGICFSENATFRDMIYKVHTIPPELLVAKFHEAVQHHL